ncbi:MAG: GNAT family N-acetyltransferase [Anaerolineae bacterium]|nr:GNAT family N-acetyltransferase [Anaerolineae bacterium]
MSIGSDLQIQKVNPTVEDAQRLIAELDAYQSSLYPPESNHLDGIAELASPNVTFVVAYHDGQAVGCGAVKVIGKGAYGEIKRLYVSPSSRGLGIAKAVMAALEADMITQGIDVTRLETGIHQEAALRLYDQLGYRRIGPFGAYREDPLSIFMEKRLG